MTLPGRKGQPLQKRWLVLAGVIVLALIFLIPFIREGGARVDTNVVVETETAVLGDIEETTQGQGQIDSAKSTPITAEYTGKVSTVAVEAGDEVQQGDILIVYDTENLNEQIDSLLDELDELDEQIAQADKSGSSSITAEVSGLVKAIYAKRGDVVTNVVETRGGLMEISADGRLRVELTLAEEDELAVGDLVKVQIGEAAEEGVLVALDEETREARVTFADNAAYALDETVQVLDETEKLLGSGKIRSNSPYLVRGDYGIVSQVNVQVGDAVSEGDDLFTRIEAEYNAQYLDLLNQRMELIEQVYALQEFRKNPILLCDGEGVIDDLTLETGEMIQAGDQVCSLVSTDSFTLSVGIVEQDIAKVKVGQQARLTFDAFEGTSYQGRVEKVSSLGEQVGGLTTYQVTISLEDAEGLKVAMSAKAEIILDSAENTLLVPIEAVKTQEDGSEAVEISYGDGLTKMCRVEVGLRNAEYAQILSGVYEGDEVVVASHVVERKIFSFLNYEWIIEEEPQEEAAQTEEP